MGILDDIEVVYRPIVTAKPTTVSTTTTTLTTTTTHDPIADHVNLLLQQYFSTQTPDIDNSDKGVPMITYDDENNSIVMEYLSPDGSTSSTRNQEQNENENLEPKQKVAEAVPN